MIELVPQTLESLKETKAGVLLVDKPTGWTSHDVVGWVRRQVGVKRVGHAGTLDPLATGLLIVLVGREFTKLQDTFMKQDKVYEVTARFGVTTDTYDSQGNVTGSVDWTELKQLTKKQIELAMNDFLGEIEQTVPIYSAVKVAGQKLYNMARHGEVAQSLPSRKVTIFDFRLLDFRLSESDKTCEADFVVKVSSGTYIRSLIHDLGNKLSVGANVTVLRRLKIGEIDLTGSIVPVSKRLS